MSESLQPYQDWARGFAATCFLAAGCLLAGPAASEVRPDTPTTILHSPREAPTMEEFLADAPVIRLDTPRHAVGLKGWSPSDLRATARVVYDEIGLWMRFEVTDDVFHQPHSDARAREGDSVQVMIRADGEAVTHAFLYALAPDGPKAFRSSGRGGAGTLTTRRAADTLTYDVRIPWSSLVPLAHRPGLRFRMNLLVNENDGHGHRGRLSLAPGSGDGDDPARWPEWTLGDGR